MYRRETQNWNRSMAAQPGADNIPSFKVCILCFQLVEFVLELLSFWLCLFTRCFSTF